MLQVPYLVLSLRLKKERKKGRKKERKKERKKGRSERGAGKISRTVAGNYFVK